MSFALRYWGLNALFCSFQIYAGFSIILGLSPPIYKKKGLKWIIFKVILTLKNLRFHQDPTPVICPRKISIELFLKTSWTGGAGWESVTHTCSHLWNSFHCFISQGSVCIYNPSPHISSSIQPGLDCCVGPTPASQSSPFNCQDQPSWKHLKSFHGREGRGAHSPSPGAHELPGVRNHHPWDPAALQPACSWFPGQVVKITRKICFSYYLVPYKMHVNSIAYFIILFECYILLVCVILSKTRF